MNFISYLSSYKNIYKIDINEFFFKIYNTCNIRHTMEIYFHKHYIIIKALKLKLNLNNFVFLNVIYFEIFMWKMFLQSFSFRTM